MKLVKENINEKFSEGGDPVEDMEIGTKYEILKDLKAANIPEGSVDIDDDFFIHSKTGRTWKSDKLLEIQLKYLTDEQRLFAKSIIDLQNHSSGHTKMFADYVQEALDNKITPELIKKIVKEFGSEVQDKQVHIVLAKLTRTKKKVKEDKQNNMYVFIGFIEDTPVTVNGETYYKKQLQAEKMVKIDRYNPSDLMQVSVMKLRMRAQYGVDSGAAVYFIHVPKDFMDEDYYNGIPEENRYIIEKYKKKL